MGCETTGDRWSETMRLLDYGFANYEAFCAAEAGQSFGSIPVKKGQAHQVDVVCGEGLSLMLQKGQGADLQTEVILPETAKAKDRRGDCR